MKLRYATMVAAILAASLAAVVLASCDPPNESARVYIEYEQLANFHDYKTAPDASGTYSADPGRIYVLYQIRKITNTGPQAQTFVFNKYNPRTETSEGIETDTAAGDFQLLGASLVDNLSVAPGETKVNPGCIIKQAAVSQLPLGSLVDLQHGPVGNPAGSQPVTMTRVPGDTTTAIIDIGLPSTLQNLCAGIFAP